MAGFRVDAFKGIRPRLNARLLPPGEAQTALNTRLGSGALEPWNAPLATTDTFNPSTDVLYLYDNAGSPLWLQFEGDYDVVPGPVPDDLLERTYYTGAAQPRMTYRTIVGSDYRYLGIPAPNAAPTLTGDAVPDISVGGTMTLGSLNTETLKADFVNEDNLPVASVDGWYMSDGSGYEPASTVRVYTFALSVGQELRVASVVDTNIVTIEDAAGGAYIAASTEQARSTGGILHFRTDDTGTTRDGYARFYIPNGVEVTFPSHGLQVGDVIRVSEISVPVELVLTQPSVAAAAGVFFGYESDQSGGNVATNTWPAAPVSVAPDDFWIAGARAYPFVDIGATQSLSGTDFVINGQFSWELIERDGVSYSDIATDVETRIYVYTYVSFLGEEGPPSDPSAAIVIPTEGEVVVTMTGTPPTTQRDIDYWRIYRANTGSGDTDFQFVAEVAIGTTTYADNVVDTDLGEVLQTTTWDPPEATMTGLTALPNGGMAGFYKKTVFFAEPYFPHAWPPEYRIAVEHDIIGLAPVPNGVAILTKGPVYIASGDHPRAMSLRRYNDSQACVSKRSIASTIDGVLYSAPDGLAFVGASGFRLVTDGYVTKREWQAGFEPSAIRGFWHDGKYIGFHTTGGFVFDPDDPSIGLSKHDFVVTAAYLDTEDDTLYVAGPTVTTVAADSVLMVVSSAGTGTAADIVKMSSSLVFTACGPSTGNRQWQDIAYAPGFGNWVAVASAGTGRIAYSPDETNWTNATITGGGSQAWLGIANSPTLGRMVAVSWTGTGRIAYSDDGGENWTAITTYDAASFQGVRWDPYRALFLAGTPTAGAQVWTSPDGLTWTSRSTPNPSGSGGNAFMITEDWITMTTVNSNPMPRSADGITWTAAPNNAADKVRGAGNATTAVAAGSTGKARSSDGGTTAWTSVTGIDFTYGAVGYSNTLGRWFMFPASDGSARYASSTDENAATWTTTAEAAFGSKSWTNIGFGDAVDVIGIWDGDTGTQMTTTWKSGRVVCPHPLNLGAARVVADAYPVTFTLYNDQGDTVTSRSITSSEVFRLPGGYLTDWFEIELQSTEEVSTVHVAETVEELLQG